MGHPGPGDPRAYEALDQAGIVIPFPQRTLSFRPPLPPTDGLEPDGPGPVADHAR